MFNNPPPEDRKRHPLEREPQQKATPPPPADGSEPPRRSTEPPRQRVTLHIATVKPYVTYGIIAINVAIFVLRALNRQIDFDLLLWGANHPPDVLQNGEVYRLVTSMFLHASIYSTFGAFALQNALHLIFNMYILYMEGTRTEQIFGHLRFAAIYFLGGLAGSVLSTVLNDPSVYSLGASGAVFAVLGARWVFLYKHRILFGAGGRFERARVTQLLVLNLVFGLLTALSGGSALGRVDNFAHLGGALGGAALAWAIAPFFVLRTHPDQTNHLVAEDINPLRNHYRELTLFALSLMAVLIVGRLMFA
ncbi:MAG: rhomboid family intramembrane serine protease [Chloroflexi bacterium]|nr:rhomboid family intramembrane serine protease [Chloroflexota bacterium]